MHFRFKIIHIKPTLLKEDCAIINYKVTRISKSHIRKLSGIEVIAHAIRLL
jgi:hypothetical protein